MQTQWLTAVLVGLSLISSSDSHMILKFPKPFAPKDNPLSNRPLVSGQFPCRPEGNTSSWYDRKSIQNTITAGDTQTLSFEGTAVHGGGSCQLAITSDLEPTASTSWKVMLSVEGGCPSKDGSHPSTYDFKIPETIPPGEYTFAWIWISKLAGLREYYMNCAPITVAASAEGGHSNNETLVAEPEYWFPELFVANLADINDCKTTDSTDVAFPNPGPNVIRPGTNSKFGPITGDNSRCIPRVEQMSHQGPRNGEPQLPHVRSDAAPEGAHTNPGECDVETASTLSATSFIPSTLVSMSSTAPHPVGISTSIVSQEAPAPGIGVIEFTSLAPPVLATMTTPAASPAGSAAPPGPPGPVGGLVVGLNGPCTEEGTFNCDGSMYQQCAAGQWTVMGALPAGTRCTIGKSMGLWRRV